MGNQYETNITDTDNFKSLLETADSRSFSIDEDDEALNKKLDSFWSESETLQKKKEDWCNSNRKMYQGQHWKKTRAKHKSDIVLNLEFMSVETVVPLMTDRQPQPVCIQANETEESRKQADKVEKALQYHWRRLKMPMMSEEIVRHMMLYRDAIVLPFWDADTGEFGDIGNELLKPFNVRIDPNATGIDDADYFITAVPKSTKYIREKYPEKALELIDNLEADKSGEESEFSDNKKSKTKVLLKQFWFWMPVKAKDADGSEHYEHKIVRIVKVKDIILKKDINPYFDNEGKQTTVPDKLKGGTKVETKLYNHFDNPKIPAVMFSTFNLGDELYSSTSQIEQTADLNRSINERKAQIQDNTNLMVDSIWIIDEESGVDENLLYNKPGLIVKKHQGSEVRRESGVPLPAEVFNDLQHSQQVFDNIFGSHDITRGEQGAQRTATEATILRQSDQGRVALLIRHFEAGLEELFNWWVHLMKMYYTQAHTIKIYGKKGSNEYMDLTRDDIEDGIEVIVKVGSTAPVDKIAQRNELFDLTMKGLLDPLTLYEKLDFEDPEKLIKRLIAWKNGTMVQQMQEESGQMPPPQQLQPGGPPTQGDMGPQGPQPPAPNMPPQGPMPPQGLDKSQVGPPTEKIPADIQEAREEMDALLAGQVVPPNQNPTKAHLLEHTRIFNEEKDKNMPKEIMMAIENHVAQEVEIYKSLNGG